MTKQDIIDYWWPFHQLGTRSVEGAPEHMHEPIRMRNRWRLPLLVPFIRRWIVLIGVLGLSVSLIDRIPPSLPQFLLFVIVFTAFWAAICLTGFMVWLYSMRPR